MSFEDEIQAVIDDIRGGSGKLRLGRDFDVEAARRIVLTKRELSSVLLRIEHYRALVRSLAGDHAQETP